MKTSQDLKQQQKLKLTPQLQQTLRLLAFSSQELDQEIQEILDINPLIEYEYVDDLPEKEAADPYQNVAEESSLKQHLLWQMELCAFSEKERSIAITLIDAISEEGYLSCLLEEVQESLTAQGQREIALSEIEAVLSSLQQWEPTGVGARSLSECLMIQLNALPPSTPHLETTKQLVMHHLPSLGKRNLTKLRDLMKLSQPDLEGSLGLLWQCDPKPGRKLSPIKRSNTIIPDLTVRDKNGNYVVELNMNGVRQLRINTEYAALLKRAGTEQAATSLREHLREAEWFIKGLKNRYATLLKIGSCIVEQQKGFLEKGEAGMKGLILQDIARLTHLHESTVSRAIAQKYLYTPRGVFELKYFFSAEVQTPTGSQSATAIRAAIKKLISEESSKQPLSDAGIAKALAKLGLSVARRTITKYREALRIPSSQERRQNYPFFLEEE